MHELITLNVHVHLQFTWTQQVISVFIGPSTWSHKPMQWKIHLPCTRVNSCTQPFPAINTCAMLHNSPTWRRLKCCKSESLTIPKGTSSSFFKKFRSEIQLHLVEFSDLKFLDLHHLIYWSSVLQKEPRKGTQIFIIQRFWSTGFCFESHYSLIHWPWYCVVWSPLYRGIIIECLIVEIEQVQLNTTKLPSLISLLIGI